MIYFVCKTKLIITIADGGNVLIDDLLFQVIQKKSKHVLQNMNINSLDVFVED